MNFTCRCSTKNYIDGDTKSNTVIALFCMALVVAFSTAPINPSNTSQRQGKLSILEAHLIWTEDPIISTHVFINVEILDEDF